MTRTRHIEGDEKCVRSRSVTTLAPSRCRATTVALVLAIAWSVAVGTPAAAADLGAGADCCSDLEERVAELEATAVRRGNRRVSLDISGQISHAIMAWDDGHERNVYEVMNSNSTDRFRLDGSARISSDLRAGYTIEIGLANASSGGVTQLSDDGLAGSITPRTSVWYVDSKALGALSVGLASPATDDIGAYNLGGTNVAGSANGSQVGGGLFTRDATVPGAAGLNDLSSGNTMSLRWRRFMAQLDAPQLNIVRYDSPVLLGLTASAAWGEDDYWDVALRYAKVTGELRLAAGIGYSEDTSEANDTLGWPPGGDAEPGGGNTMIREIKGSASVLHVPSGLFLSGAYLHREFAGSDDGVVTFACFGSGDAESIRSLGIGCSNRPDFDYYWLNAGIRRNFIELGWTSIYAEYGRSEEAVTGLNVSVASAAGGDLDYVTSSSMELWGVGVVQHIGAAALDLFVSYRNFSAEVKGVEASGGRVSAPIEDAHLVLVGSRIRF